MSALQIRQLTGRLWERWVVRVSVTQIVVSGVLVYGFDTFFDVLHTSAWWSGPVDWIAHIGTALLVLNMLPWGWRRAILLPALLGSFLIDLDHIPKFLGYSFLTEGTPRPYTHSLTTPIVLTLAGLLVGIRWPKVRAALIGFGFGVCLHFLRDLAESPGVGIPMFWPLTKRAYSYPHRLYLVVIAALLVANLLRLAGEGALGTGAGTGTEPLPEPVI